MTYIQWFNIVQLFNIVSWFESVHNALWDENLSNRKDGFPAFSFSYFLIPISGSNQWVLRIICVEKWIGKYIKNTENVGSGFYAFAAKYNILCLRLCCIVLHFYFHWRNIGNSSHHALFGHVHAQFLFTVYPVILSHSIFKDLLVQNFPQFVH